MEAQAEEAERLEAKRQAPLPYLKACHVDSFKKYAPVELQAMIDLRPKALLRGADEAVR